MTSTEKKSVNFLKEKRVFVKPFNKPGLWSTLLVSDINENSSMYPNTKTFVSLPIDINKGNVVVQVFDNTTKYYINKYDQEMTEQEFFEKELSLNKGDMNPTKLDGFWRKDTRARVIIPREGLVLDLRNPLDYIKYVIIKNCSNIVAPSWEKRYNNPEYRYAIVDEDVESDIQSEQMKLELQALEYFEKVVSSKESMMNFLKVKGETVPSSIKEAKMKSDIYKAMKERPRDFIRILSDKNYDEKVLLIDGIRCGAIIKSGKNSYELPGGILIGESEQETINYLLSPENSAVRLKIKGQIENSK